MSQTDLKFRLAEKGSGCGTLLVFLENITFCACVAQSGLNDNFHCYICSSISNRSLLSVAAETFT